MFNKKEDVISARVFVGNLSYDTTEVEIEEMFAEVGKVVEVFLPIDRNTGRPRGIAFVELSSQSEVRGAVEKLDGHELQGRTLRVNEAEDRPSRPRGFSDEGRSFSHPGAKRSKPKGSRRNLRRKKRSL